jgi:4-hydroxybenzoate polyprenyltransferase
MRPISSAEHSDIKYNHWLLRKSPKALIPYILLMRLDRPIGIYLVLYPALWALALAMKPFWHMNVHDVKLIVIMIFGAIFMRSAGCIINDLWDQELDQKVTRTKDRPLAAGHITRVQAYVALALLLMLAASLLLFLNLTVLVLASLGLIMIAIYPYMKRITWWPQLFLGLTFNMGVLIAYAAVHNTLKAEAYVLYAAAVFWTLAYDTIYAHQDLEDDMKIGIHSTARLFGQQSKKIVALFYAVMIVLLFAAKPIALIGGLLLLPLGHIIYLMIKWQPHDKTSSLKSFKANHLTGAFILLYCLF